MKISDRLLQIYFLGMHPAEQEAVAAALQSAPATSYASPWSIYSRLARPGLIAARHVSRSTGLDIFLLETQELFGVEDVAEIISFSFENGQPEEEMKIFNSSASLFITFVRLNWDVLHDEKLWEEYGICHPPRSQIFMSFRTALREAVSQGVLNQHSMAYQMRGGIGDCDAVIVGNASTRAGLDLFLLTLSRLGTDNLALQLSASRERIQRSFPIVATSTTELAMEWDLFRELLAAARLARQENKGPSLHPSEENLRMKVNGLLDGGLRAAVFLRRSRSLLANVQDRLRRILPEGWAVQEVLGEADILLRFKESASHASQDLHDLVSLNARLDHEAAQDSYFPRRHSVVLSFDNYHLENVGHASCDRATVLGVVPGSICEEMGDARPRRQEVAKGLARCVDYLNSIHDFRLREELRIIERMVERCAVLQRQVDLPAETRRVAQLGLQRIVRTLDQLRQMEEAGKTELAFALRHSLVNSGAHLERTFSHLSRGNVPLLLATATQARTMDHFSSETILATALAAPASSVAGRLASSLEALKPTMGDEPPQWAALMETLQDMAEPLIYTSHDLDFTLARPLGIIHVPRWIMWYPTSSSLILHEVGHAIFAAGHLNELLQASAHDARQNVLHKWCSQVSAGCKAPGEKLSGLAGNPEQWRSDQHEVAAELFSRLFSYPAAADEAYLFDQLEYLHTISNRTENLGRTSFIGRVLSVHIAHSLLRHTQRGPSLWERTGPETRVWIREAVDDFRKYLRQWLRSPPPPFGSLAASGSLPLLAEVKDLALTMALQVLRDEDLRAFKSNVGLAIQRGVFMALTAQKWMAKPPTTGLLLGQTVWQAIIRASRLPESADASAERGIFDAALQKLQAGEVPTFPCPWPERLPRMLHHALRRSGSGSVMVKQRLALSFYLTDWMSLRSKTNTCSA